MLAGKHSCAAIPRAVLVERYEALFAQVIQDHRKRQR